MKKFIITSVIFLSAVSGLMTSCEKDKPLSDNMIGKWDVEYVTQLTYKNNVLVSEYKEYQTAGTVIIQFVSGGTGIYSDTTGDYVFNWSLAGDVLSLTNFSSSTIKWNLKMDGDKLVWSFDQQDSEDLTIKYNIAFTAHRKS